MIFLKLFEKGYFMTHSGGICSNKNVILFPGRGGSFKTSLIMDFLRNAEYSYLGDDWVILQNDTVFSFPAHFSIFNYIFSSKKGEDLSFLDRILFISTFWRPTSRLKNIAITDQGKLKGIVFIERTTGDTISTKKISGKEAIEKLIENNYLELNSKSDTFAGFSLGPFYTYLTAYSYIFPDSTLSSMWNQWHDNLVSIVNNAACLILYLPNKYTDDIFQNIKKIVEGIS